MRKHLLKSGLITRQGEVVPESVYRLNSSRKDHRRNVRDLLAQAIVHKTLDYERSRQVAIRRKLEDIAKIEMVRRVRAERHRKGDEDIVPLMSPRVRRPRRAPNRLRDSGEGSTSDSADQKSGVDPVYVDSHGMPVSPDAESRARLLRKFPEEEIDSKHLYSLDSVALREYAKVLERYERGRTARSPYMMSQLPRPPTAGSNAATTSRRTTPNGPGGRGSKSAGSKTKPISKRFAWKATKTGGGPALTPIVRLPPALPPNSPSDEMCRPRHQRTITVRLPAAPIPADSGRQRANGGGDNPAAQALSPELSKLLMAMGDELQFRRSMGFARLRSPEEKGTLVMHRPEPAVMQQSRFQSLCEVEMRYYGQNLGGAAARDDMDPAQEVLVEQQHCGGNTLIVFKRSILPGTNFSFFSRRHRGYPFSLTFYINGVKDSRLSTCCEYRHRNGSRLGGKQGHFGFVKVKGAAPCYKCQVERGMIASPAKDKKKKKSKEEVEEDGYAAASADYDDDEFEEEEEEDVEEEEEEIGVAVEDDESDRDELGPLSSSRAPVEVAVESDVGCQVLSPIPPPVGRSVRRNTRLRRVATAAEEEEERRLLAEVAREIGASDSELEARLEKERGRKQKRKMRPKAKLKEQPEPHPESSASTAESMSLPPSMSLEEERKSKKLESVKTEEAKGLGDSLGKTEVVPTATDLKLLEEAGDKTGFEEGCDEETRNDADEEVDKEFSDQREWSVDSKDCESAEGSVGVAPCNLQPSESNTDKQKTNNEGRRQLFRTKGRLERSKVMEERVDGDQEVAVGELKEKKEEEEGESAQEIRGQEEREEKTGIKASSSPRGRRASPLPQSPTSQASNNEYQEDFEADVAGDDNGSDASDAEGKDSAKSGSSKSSSAHSSPRSSGREESEKEVDRLLRALSSSSRASIRRVCVMMAREICLHFVECRRERRRLRKALQAAKGCSDSEKKEEKEETKAEEEEEEVHPVGFNDEEAVPEKDAEAEDDDKGSARSSSSSSSSSSASSSALKAAVKEKEKEEASAVEEDEEEDTAAAKGTLMLSSHSSPSVSQHQASSRGRLYSSPSSSDTDG